MIGDRQQKVANQRHNWRPEPAVQQFNQASLCKKIKINTNIVKTQRPHPQNERRHNKNDTHIPGTHTLSTSQKRM